MRRIYHFREINGGAGPRLRSGREMNPPLGVIEQRVPEAIERDALLATLCELIALDPHFSAAYEAASQAHLHCECLAKVGRVHFD